MEVQQNDTILSVLEHHAPSLMEDNAIADYVVRILTDEDAFADPDELESILTSFVGTAEKAAKIIRELEPNGKDRATLSRPPLEAVHEESSSNNEIETEKIPRMLPAGSTSGNAGEETTQTQEKPSTKSKRRVRHQRQRKGIKAQAAQAEETQVEDDASAWNDCKEQGQVWGGRGKGGRGEYSGAVNSVKSNIHLTNVTVSLPNGTDLLASAVMDIQKGHRYGLVGRNGVGKSFLLKRLAQRAVPGMPHDMRVLLVQQQIEGSDETPVQVLLKADVDRLQLLEEQERLEAQMDASGELNEQHLTETAERLGDIVGELDAIEADKAEERALDILKGLQFTPTMLQGPTHNLSGGWRMRLGLARALFVKSDLLLLDEASNHIDLAGLDWLIRYLTKDDERTMILVSHDRYFLDAVCTDVIHMNHQKLKYHVGNFSEFERQQEEKSAREAQILDAAERKRSKAQAFVQKQQAMANKKSADPNKQRQAKMIKEKKLDRIGNYREDGKRFKQNSLAKLSEKHIRTAQKVEIEVDEPVIKMNFPNPPWPPGIAPDGAIIKMDGFSFAYSSDGSKILKKNTLSLRRGSKAALVGRNGAGKTTLMQLLARNANPSEFATSGSLWHHPNLRIGYITQYSVEELEEFAEQTVVDYAEEKFRGGMASSSVVSKASGNVRQYLGAFGLGGKHALQPIGKLSGGERMRLCFATVLAEEPHLLLLDESTNHCDYETLGSMSEALSEYEGSVLMVSHNQGFLSGFCKELWVLEGGVITVNHSDTESFDELFSEYRSSATNGSGSQVSARRRAQAVNAKRATQQRANAKQNTALL